MVDANSHKYFIMVVGCFFLYLVGWSISRDDPKQALLTFLSNPATRSHNFDPPKPSPLSALRAIVKADDLALFDRARDMISQDPRNAGQIFWPLMARYPVLRPSLADLYFGRAQAALSQGQFWKARELGKMAVTTDPLDHRSHRLLAEVAGRLQRPQEEAAHRQLSRVMPPGWRPPAPAPDWSIVALVLLAFASVMAGLHAYRGKLGVDRLLGADASPGERSDHGLPAMESEVEAPTTIQNMEELRAVRREKKKTITAILSAEAFLKDIQDAFDNKQYERGVDLCAKAVELNDANCKKVSALCLAEGIRLFEVGAYPNSRELLEVSLHFEPHILEAHTCLGNCYIKMGDFENARLQYEKVIEVDPKNAAAYYTLGVCYQKVNDPARARRSFEVSVQIDDSHANCHFYLAKLKEGEQDFRGAILHWTRFIELKPDSPHAGAARERLGKLAELATPAPPPA